MRITHRNERLPKTLGKGAEYAKTGADAAQLLDKVMCEQDRSTC